LTLPEARLVCGGGSSRLARRFGPFGPCAPSTASITSQVMRDREFDGELDLIGSLRTADGLFVTDKDQRVRFWSPAAERILGIPAEDVVGRRCYEVMVGSDIAGHPFCRDRCPIAANAAKGRPVRDYDVVVEGRGGARKLINNSVLLLPERGGGYAIVHLFRELKKRARPRHSLTRRPAPTECAEPPAIATPLSRREMEVLSLMASGLRTAEIASELGVSFFTARNQLSSLMRKLNVRNRTEAVVRATQSGLV